MFRHFVVLAILWVCAFADGLCAQVPTKIDSSSGQAFSPVIPKTWDDAAMATLEVPLADPIGSPKHVPADYYYKIPVRPIYKEYPLYAPGREPPGYMDWLKRQEPTVVWGEVAPSHLLATRRAYYLPPAPGGLLPKHCAVISDALNTPNRERGNVQPT